MSMAEFRELFDKLKDGDGKLFSLVYNNDHPVEIGRDTGPVIFHSIEESQIWGAAITTVIESFTHPEVHKVVLPIRIVEI